MKTKLFFIVIAVVSSLVIFSCKTKGGTSDTKENDNGIKVEVEATKSLNISMFLDLSDRLVKDMEPNQMYRDTAIINTFVDYFVKSTLGPQILKSENKMKVLFYPTPSSSQIATIAQGLNVDISQYKGVEKRKCLESMKANFANNLTQLYEETINQKKWVGCDIWDFFNSGKVDQICVKPDARNIMVILSDGYLFHENNKIKKDNAYSYILPQTLDNPQSSLIVDREGKLDKLEVLLLEVNPMQPSHRAKMIRVLEKWLDNMGVKRHVVAETDANLTNTQTIIQNFMNQQ